jgi:hypothetical protein
MRRVLLLLFLVSSALIVSREMGLHLPVLRPRHL